MALEFTVDHDQTVFADEGEEQLIGNIYFTVQTRPGDFQVRDSGAPTPRTITLPRRTGYLGIDGHLYKDSTQAEPFRLVGNDPAFNLDHITYRADFELTTLIGESIPVRHTYFPAPGTDTTLYLTKVINDPDQIVMMVRSKVYAEDILDAGTVGGAVVKAVTAAEARTAIGVDLVDLDEWEEYANLAAFPVTGAANVVYVALDTGALYRWSGSVYALATQDIAARTNLAPSKTALVDADKIPLVDSEAANGLKKFTIGDLRLPFILAHNAATNLLIDGSYEQDATWWAGEIGTGKALSTDQAFNGTQSFKITGARSHFPNVTAAGKTGFDATYGVLKAEGGRLYRLSCKVWRAAGNTSSGQFKALLNCVGTAGTDSVNGFGPNATVAQTNLATGQWVTYINYFVVPMSGTNYPYSGAYPTISTPSVDSADVFYIDNIRFEDLTNAPLEIQAPEATGVQATDEANIQPLVDLVQLYRGTLKLRATPTTPYVMDIVTAKVIPQPRIIGMGKQYTQWDGTLKFQGVSAAFSGGWFSDFKFVGSHAGQAAVELNGACDVHWDRVRAEGTYGTGIWFHNELSGDYVELCYGNMDFYLTVTTALKYTADVPGWGSFHWSGLIGGAIQQGPGPAVLIESTARPYNAPLTVGVWTSSATYPVIQHNGDTQSDFHGELTVEQSAVAPLAAGNYLLFAGNISPYMGPGLALDKGTLLEAVAGWHKVSGGSATPLPINVASGGALAVYNTADQITNFERGQIKWTGNALTISVDKGGTGTQRDLQLSNGGGLLIVQDAPQGPTTGSISLFSSTATVGAATAAVIGTGSASSGLQYGLSVSPTYNQSGTAGYIAHLVNVTETALGSGVHKLASWQVGGVEKASLDNTGVLTVAAVGTAAGSVVTVDGTQELSLKTLASPAVIGTASLAQSAVAAWFNTSDQVTNYERGRVFWNGNVFTIYVDKGGTGTQRNLQLFNAGSMTGYGAVQASTVGTWSFFLSTATVSATTLGVIGTGSASSGTQVGLSVSPTYNQSGTAGYTAALVNVTETGTGSGAKKLLSLQVASAEKLGVDNTGTITLADAANLAAGTTTGTKIGTATTQKIGFWNATPAVQPTAVIDATDAATVITQLNALLARMRTLGLIAT